MTKILEIKADKNFFHHYIIAVGTKTDIRDSKHGQFYMKYKVIHFTHDDIENIRDSIMLENDLVFKTSAKKAMEICECDDLVSTLTSLKFSCNANMINMHHFSSEVELDEEWFEHIVENAHKIPSYKKLLQESLIR